MKMTFCVHVAAAVPNWGTLPRQAAPLHMRHASPPQPGSKDCVGGGGVGRGGGGGEQGGRRESGGRRRPPMARAEWKLLGGGPAPDRLPGDGTPPGLEKKYKQL